MPEIRLNLDEPRFDKVNFYRYAVCVVRMSSSDFFDGLRAGSLSFSGLDISKAFREFDDDAYIANQRFEPADKIINATNPVRKGEFIGYIYGKHVAGKSGIPINSVNGGYGNGAPVAQFIWCDRGNLDSEKFKVNQSYQAYDGNADSVSLVTKLAFFGPKPAAQKVADKTLRQTLGLSYDTASLDHVETINMYRPKENAKPSEAKEAPESEHSDEYFEVMAERMNVAEQVVCAYSYGNNAKNFALDKNRNKQYDICDNLGVIEWNKARPSVRPSIPGNARFYVLMGIDDLSLFLKSLYLKAPYAGPDAIKTADDIIKDGKTYDVTSANIRFRTDEQFVKELGNKRFTGYNAAPYIKYNPASKSIHPIITTHLSDVTNLFTPMNRYMTATEFTDKTLKNAGIDTFKKLVDYVLSNVIAGGMSLKGIYYASGGNIIKLK